MKTPQIIRSSSTLTLLLLTLITVLLLVSPAISLANDGFSVGGDLEAYAPDTACASNECALISTYEAPQAGEIVKLRVRHSHAGGAISPTRIYAQAYNAAGVLLRESDAAALTGTQSDQITEVAVHLKINEGEFFGVRTSGGWIGTPIKLLAKDAENPIVERSNNSEVTHQNTELLVRFIYGDNTNEDDDESGDDTASSGGATKTTSQTHNPKNARGCESLNSLRTGFPKTLRTQKTRARGKGWAGLVLGKQDNFNDISLALDKRGIPHIAARGVFHGGAYYFTPNKTLHIGRATHLTGEGISLMLHGSKPVISWGSRESLVDGSGLIQSCAALWITKLTTKSTTQIAALPAKQKGFFYTDTAVDHQGKIHAAYDTGKQGYYLAPSGKTTKLNLGSAPRAVKIRVHKKKVFITAKTSSNQLYLFTKQGSRFKKTRIADRVGSYDAALTSSGQIRVALATGSLPKLAYFNGKKLKKTSIPVGTVGLAVRGSTPHVVFTRTGRPTCSVLYGCMANGIHHLSANAAFTKGRISMVQASVGYSPVRFSLAVSGRKLAVAYGDPGNKGAITVRWRYF